MSSKKLPKKPEDETSTGEEENISEMLNKLKLYIESKYYYF